MKSSHHCVYPRNLFFSFVVIPENPAEKKEARRKQQQQWSPTEITAVMGHFKNNFSQGSRSTKIDYQQCKNAEHPALANHSLQNFGELGIGV